MLYYKFRHTSVYFTATSQALLGWVVRRESLEVVVYVQTTDTFSMSFLRREEIGDVCTQARRAGVDFHLTLSEHYQCHNAKRTALDRA